MKDGLSTVGLSYSYGANPVLQDVELNVSAGEVVGLLGPNGAGKTTTFKLIAGALKTQVGHISLNGTDLRGPLWRRARLGLSYVPQTASVLKKMTVRDNVALGLRSQTAHKLDSVLERFGLAEIADRAAGVLSGGERRRVELARAFASQSTIFLVDEPFAGLDPKSVTDLSMYLRNCAKDGVGVLLTDHYVAQALDLCHRIYILNEGRVICSGSSEEVAQNPLVRHTYLGAEFLQ